MFSPPQNTNMHVHKAVLATLYHLVSGFGPLYPSSFYPHRVEIQRKSTSSKWGLQSDESECWKAIERSVPPPQAFIWGHNDYGQLGFGQTKDEVVQEPRPINANDTTSWTQIECGERHTVALSSSGDVFTWGWSYYGQLGRWNDYKNSNVPEKVARFSEDRIIKVACSNFFTAALTSKGELFAWYVFYYTIA